ncbi:unnamed protein product [Rotaria sp. Silwood2]|nr:unnamed protein product [Rotaria sp. Silwood2]CAF4166361.1 unnamed protein product [Rotaria sp. Silwood2]
MNSCLIDKFPVELIHNLFDYFLALEILLIFSNVSQYLDSVLLNYSSYWINFKSIRRAHFDLVCQRILPNQVISLTISDDYDTPGQIELFVSHFRLEQFARLRSFKLIDVEPYWWERIFSNLTQLTNLHSSFYDTPEITEQWFSDLLSHDEQIVLDTHLIKTHASILPQLTRIRLPHGDYLKSTTLPRLRQLILDQCSPETLKYICSAAPQLKVLDVYLHCDSTETKFLFPFHSLKRLVLRIRGQC